MIIMITLQETLMRFTLMMKILMLEKPCMLRMGRYRNIVRKYIIYFFTQLGLITSKGFLFATNFLVDIESQVYSEKYSIKGDKNKTC